MKGRRPESHHHLLYPSPSMYVHDIHGTVIDSCKSAYASRWNPAQLQKIYIILAYKLHKLHMNYVILNQIKILNSLKPKSHEDPLAETLDWYLRTSIHDKRKITHVSRKTKILYVENAQNVSSCSVTGSIHLSLKYFTIHLQHNNGILHFHDVPFSLFSI